MGSDGADEVTVMSKTDKTRPFWVRGAERPLHTCVPVHRHENGVCDLPADPTDSLRPGHGYDRQGCYWTYGPDAYYGRGKGCGCPMCTAQIERRAERRRDRRAGREACRDAEAAFRAGQAEDH